MPVDPRLPGHHPAMSDGPPLPPDFDEFWASSLHELGSGELDVVAHEVSTPMTQVRVLDLRFTGAADQRVAAWLVLPARASGSLPAVVQFLGYGGGRGSWLTHLAWAAAGYAHLVMDTRGQGADTGDEPGQRLGGGAWGPGFVTRGLPDRDTYYYRRVHVDAARAVAVAAARPEVDADRVSVLGTSQGGAIATAASVLSPLVRAAMVDVPFACDWRTSCRDAQTPPFREVAEFVRRRPGSAEQVHTTLDYFDTVNFARRSRVPAIFSVAAQDVVCPPEAIRRAVHEHAGPTECVEHPYDDHVDPGFHREHHQMLRQMAWLDGLGLAPVG